MTRRVTRIDFAQTFETTFFMEDTTLGVGADIHVPKNQADDYETAIIAASWTTLTNLFNLAGTTIIKTE